MQVRVLPLPSLKSMTRKDNAWAEEQQMVEDCEARESRCTEWERTFLDSLSKQLGAGRGLSARQKETLDNIWERVTAKG